MTTKTPSSVSRGLWFKMRTSVLDDMALAKLGDRTFRLLMLLMAYAKERDIGGCQPGDIAEIAWRLRCDERDLTCSMDELKTAGFIERYGDFYRISGWHRQQYCRSLERTRRWRDKKRIEGNKSMGNKAESEHVKMADDMASHGGNGASQAVSHGKKGVSPGRHRPPRHGDAFKEGNGGSDVTPIRVEKRRVEERRGEERGEEERGEEVPPPPFAYAELEEGRRDEIDDLVEFFGRKFPLCPGWSVENRRDVIGGRILSSGLWSIDEIREAITGLAQLYPGLDATPRDLMNHLNGVYRERRGRNVSHTGRSYSTLMELERMKWENEEYSGEYVVREPGWLSRELEQKCGIAQSSAPG